MQNRKISALLQALFPPPGVFPHPALADSRLPEHNRNQRGACTSSVLLPEISLVFERNFGYTFLVCYLVSLRTVLQLKNAPFLQFPAGTLFPFHTVMALFGPGQFCTPPFSNTVNWISSFWTCFWKSYLFCTSVPSTCTPGREGAGRPPQAPPPQPSFQS